MRVYSVETENFRLLEPGRVEFDEKTTVITGNNAQGKTSLLEAVYLLTGEKSFRTWYDRELIAFGLEQARVAGQYRAAGRDQNMEILLSKGRARQVRVNGSKRKPSEREQSLQMVLFSPDELGMIRGPAAGRRRFLDAAISQLRPGYAALLSDYNRIYENKLRILRDWREKPDLLDALDEFSESLCRCSARMIRYRAAFAQKLVPAAAAIQADFSSGGEELALQYVTVSTVRDPLAPEGEILAAVRERQAQLRQAELDSGSCLVGAHKDDLAITINGTDARAYASQGQARTAALSLKLAERELFHKDTGEIPVLLLDDVLSELDAARQEFVLNRIRDGQTIITCCDAASVTRLLGGRLLTMEQGRIRG